MRRFWMLGVAKPAAGWTASSIQFTTEVSVIPDTLPFKWKDARPITAPDGK